MYCFPKNYDRRVKGPGCSAEHLPRNWDERVAQQPESSFLIANAKIVDYPIVYVSDEFSSMVGYK